MAGDWQAEDVGKAFLARDPECAGSMLSVGWPSQGVTRGDQRGGCPDVCLEGQGLFAQGPLIHISFF